MQDIEKEIVVMATPQELRKIRIKNDYQEMKNIQGKIIQWRSIKGEYPYIEAYELTVNIKTIIGSSPDYRDFQILTIKLPPTYPFSPPECFMLSTPKVFHPNWYSNGRWCFGTWDISEGLGHHVIRMIRSLQFDPDITNSNSPANYSARDWYLDNLNMHLFPCDKQILPDPTKSRFTKTILKHPKFIIEKSFEGVL